ncbi:MAG TPA: response regulator [Actinomycetota bacterium]|nr:response regulator [Actinomycetota bacterium]
MSDPLRVLVVDDDPDMCRLLEVNLQLEGFDAISALDGRGALERIEEDRPDVVLLDVMMPVLDGYGVLAAMADGGHRPRVILVTAKASSESQLRGWQLGCDDYVVKPFDLDDLFGRLRAIAARSDEETAAVRVERIAALQAAARA